MLNPEKVLEIMGHIPVIDLLPLFKKAWEGMSEEEKVKFIAGAMLLVAKLA